MFHKIIKKFGYPLFKKSYFNTIALNIIILDILYSKTLSSLPIDTKHIILGKTLENNITEETNKNYDFFD